LFIFCSCSTSVGEDSAQVYLSLDSEDGYITSRAVTVTNPISLEGAVYQYKATPLWVGEDVINIQGTQSEWTTLPQNGNLGSFAQGRWEFAVQVFSSTGTGLYQGVTQHYITAGSNTISLSLTRYTGGSGNMAITITSPSVSDNDKLIIKYGLSSDMSTAIATHEDASKTSSGTGENRTSTFSKSLSGLQSGIYWVSLAYNNGVNDVGGAITVVEVVDGEESTVTGTIETGEWQTCSISTSGIKQFGVIVQPPNSESSVMSGEDIIFTCTKTAGSEDIVSYSWYVEGEKQSATGSTFTFNRTYDSMASNGNYYRINCIAGDGSDPQLCADAIWYIVVKEN